ncbi:MAG: nitroreductase family protein [Okeania sp. SIO3B3]|nr:nitroreductase family protein [Okeania sp. SIO3B3]
MEPSINLKQAIEKRRSARAFSQDSIPNVILEEILRLGMMAPSGFNLQPWRFIVVKKQENKERLKACAFNQRQVEEAPVVLICCGDRHVSKPEYIESIIELGKEHEAINDTYADYMRNSIPKIFESPPSFESMEAWINRQIMLAVAQIMLVSSSFGVDSCPLEGFITSQVKEAFNIPEQVDVCCLLAMGYAAEPLKKYGGRLSLSQVCFQETYGQDFI